MSAFLGGDSDFDTPGSNCVLADICPSVMAQQPTAESINSGGVYRCCSSLLKGLIANHSMKPCERLQFIIPAISDSDFHKSPQLLELHSIGRAPC